MFDKKTLINRFFIGIICFVMTFALAFASFSFEAYAARSVIMGQAATGEKGARGQKPGDQTGKEVAMTKWSYTKHLSPYNWTVVARAKDPARAKAMAKIMRDTCANDNVGYDAGSKRDTMSFFYALEAAGWDASKIDKPVETSCTPLIGACVYATGLNINTYRTASGLYKELQKTGEFEFFTGSDYVASSSKLQVGDILLSTRKAHGAMIVSVDGLTNPTYKAIASSKKNILAASVNNATKSKFKVGKDYQLKDVMNVRKGPGTSYAIKKYSSLTDSAKMYSIDKSKAILNKGTVVTCLRAKGNWIQIPSGWICGQSGKTSYLTEFKGTKAQKALEEKAKVVAKPTVKKTEAKGTTKKATTAKTTTTKKKTTKKTTMKKKTTKATSSKKKTVVVKKWKDYSIRKNLNVRTGPGTGYTIKSRKSLTKDALKNSVKGTKKAVLKKGTVVTCLDVKGDWMLIPSGWICCKPGNVSYTS